MPRAKDNSKYVYIGVIVVLAIILGFVFISNQQDNSNNNYNPPSTGNVIGQADEGISIGEAKETAIESIASRMPYILNYVGCEHGSGKDLELLSDYEKEGIYHFGYEINIDCVKKSGGSQHLDWIEKVCVNKQTEEVFWDVRCS